VSAPIEDYALIGDGETAALVSRGGSMDWLCWPRFDSDACFAALLGTPEHGRWLIGPADTTAGGVTAVGRRYQPDTLVVETDLATPGGTVRLIDFMPIRDGSSAVVRIVAGLSGAVPMRMDLRLRFDYGALPPWNEAAEDGVVAKVGPDLVVLHAPVPVRVHAHAAEAEFTVAAGQRLAFVLRYGPSNEPPPGTLDAEAALAATQGFWRDWIGRFDDRRTRWPEAVRRSLITLKAMIHRPTSGLVAAPTTSLPEAPGGDKNWDYRYCWLRDSTFTLSALVNAGYHDEAERWRDWLLRAVAGSPAEMRIMYRVDGGRHLPEWSVRGLPGYRYASPVRIGNAASTQLQIDVWGEVLESLHIGERAGLPGSKQADQVQAKLVEHLESVWKDAGSGVWESRQEPRQYTYSKVMAWAGIDRFLKGRASVECGEEMKYRLAALRAEIHGAVCREGWNEGLGAFTQYFGGQELDASVLLLPAAGFLPASEPRMASTIAAIGRELTQGGLVRRTAASGGSTPEGAFLACSCWMADCLNMQGRTDEAVAQLERVLAVRNDLGLLSEEYNVPGQHLAGNFPQALTHLAVVNTALGLSGPVLQRGGG
jgi:GH15 family glucan-1,4-alpha-glucosidase